MTDTPDQPRPWLASEAAASAGKRHAPATARNRAVIADLLADIFPPSGLILEIASGSGEHIVHFAQRFAALRWLPSDPDMAALGSIAAWVDEAALGNVSPPLQIDAASPESWPLAEVDAILCINMVHISPWAATLGLLRGAARLLPVGGPLYLYGPYFREGTETTPSNLAFDESLRSRDPTWGLRWVHDVALAAQGEGLTLDRIAEMPANNLSLIFRRDPLPG